jgi:hypothetical protein
MKLSVANQGENTMGGPATSAASFREKALREFKEMAALSLYLYICLGAVMLLKAAVLQDAGVNSVVWGIAAVKSLLLAKFMLLGRALELGKRFRDRPLIWPTLYHGLMFLILLLVLTTIEEIVVGSLRHRPLFDSLTHVVGHTVFEGIAVCIVLFLILVPYSERMCWVSERRSACSLWMDLGRFLFRATRPPRTGTRTCSTKVRKLPPLMGPSRTQGAVSPSQRSAARNVSVRHLPKGALATRRSPLAHRPWVRVMLVLAQVSSRKTSRFASILA